MSCVHLPAPCLSLPVTEVCEDRGLPVVPTSEPLSPEQRVIAQHGQGQEPMSWMPSPCWEAFLLQLPSGEHVFAIQESRAAPVWLKTRPFSFLSLLSPGLPAPPGTSSLPALISGSPQHPLTHRASGTIRIPPDSLLSRAPSSLCLPCLFALPSLPGAAEQPSS